MASPPAGELRRLAGDGFIRLIPLYDLAAAAYVIDPSLISVEETRARLHSNLWVEYGRGARRLRVIRDLDPDAIWRRFVDLVHG